MASTHIIPNSDLSAVKASRHLNLSSYTYSSARWNGVDGLTKGFDGVLEGVPFMNFYVPYHEQDIHLENFLDIYFRNVGSIGGWRLNAQIHVDSLDFTQEAVINHGIHDIEGYMRILELKSDTTGIFGDSAGSVKLRVTVTITYADTGSVVNLPFYQGVSDIDAVMPYIRQPESWEGIRGFTGDIYAYRAHQTGGIMVINGMHAYAIGVQGAQGDDSWLKAGLFAPVVKGTFTCEFGENNCGTELNVYSAYDDENLRCPVKSVDNSRVYEPGEEITWAVSQKVSTFYGNTFTKYHSFQFTDILPPQAAYQSARVLVNGTDVTNNLGTLQYNPLTGVVTYSLKGNILDSEAFYDGKTLTLEIKAKAVNSTKSVATARNTGSVNIDGIVKTSNEVSVNINPHFQVMTEIENGTITEQVASLPICSSHTVTWKAKEGYYVESVMVDGIAQTVKKTDGDSHTFSNITADHYVKVVCSPYRQITTEATNGTITGKITSIKNGENHVVTWKAKEGYYVESVMVDGIAQTVKKTDGDSHTFSNITADHHVKVVCSPYHKITTEIDHGTITPDQNKIKRGVQPKIVWIPETGYYVKSIMVDDTIIYNGNSTKEYDTFYVFAPVTGDHKIIVKTALIPNLKLTKTSDKNIYNYQETITYTIKAEQTVKGATADHVVITDKDITKGIDFDLATLKVSDPSARIEKDEAGNSFIVRLNQMSDIPVTIMVEAKVNNKKLESKEIKNTARIVSDQTDEVTDDSNISVYYKVTTRVTNGTITPDDEKVGRGEERVISYQPKDDSYYLESVKIDGEQQNLKDCQQKTILKDIQANYCIEVVYGKIPDIRIQKSADRKEYSSGEVVTYTLKVSQIISDAVARNVVVTDENLPEGVF